MPATVAQSLSQLGRPGLGVCSAWHGMVCGPSARMRKTRLQSASGWTQVDGNQLPDPDVQVSVYVCVSAHNKRCELQEFMGQLGVRGDKLAE